MNPWLLLFCLLFASPLFAAYETLTISHTKMVPRPLVVSGFWGSLEIVGNFDKAVDGHVVGVATLEYRIGETAWVPITGSPAGRKVWSELRSYNWRRVGFGEMQSSSFEIRACRDNTCSLPYMVSLMPQFLRVLTPTNATVTPFNQNLRFSMIHHEIGGMKFYIGKLDSYPSSTEIYYSGKEEVLPVGNCPQLPPLDRLACEIRIPESIFMQPGSYALTATSSWGASTNFLRFEVVSTFKILSTVPERIRAHIQDVITFNFAGGVFRPRDIDIIMVHPCANRRLAVTGPGNDMVMARIPPGCLPNGGIGEIEFDVKTPQGSQKVKIPYEL